MEISISVIIPIYNVQNYLEECLESVKKQTIIDRLEVLLVDDGSTDGSSKIAQRYAEKCGFVYYSKENGGLSSARNYGLQHASGKYLYFLDSDDFLAPNAMETMLEVCEKYELDVLRVSAYTFIDGESEYCWNHDGYKFHGVYNETYNAVSILKELIQNNDTDYVSTWALMIKRDFLNDNCLKFIEGIKFEDNIFQLECFMLAHRIRLLNQPLYYRRYRRGSIIDTAVIADTVCAMGNSLVRANERYKKSESNSYVEYYLHDYAWKYAGNWEKLEMTDKKRYQMLTDDVKEIINDYSMWGDRKLWLFVKKPTLFLLRQRIRKFIKDRWLFKILRK